MPVRIGFPRPNKIRKSPSQEVERRLRSARERLVAGMRYRETHREDEWHDNEDQYMPGWWEANPDDRTADIIDVPISFSTITTIVPFVTGELPNFLVEPFDAEANPQNASVLQALLNRLWRAPDARSQDALEHSAWDFLAYGDGWMKVGFEINAVPILDADGNRVKEGQEPQKAELFVERVSPWNMWIDPMSDGLYNARWVCQRIIVPKEELEDDQRYKFIDDHVPTFTDDLDADYMERLYADVMEGDEGEEPWVAIYEFYDIVNRWSMTFLLEETATPLRYIEHVSQPFVQLANHRIPNSPYHLSELEQIHSLQEELNKTRSQMITHRRRNVNKWLYRENALDETGIAQLESSIINAAIPVENETYELDDIVFPLQATALTADVYNVSDIIKADILEATGVNEYLRGELPDVRRTATEASIIEGASNIKSKDKLNRIEKALAESGQIMLEIAKDVFPLTDTDELALFLTGRDAEAVVRSQGFDEVEQDAIIRPTADIFKGDYLVRVEEGSTEIRNPLMREQKFKDMFNILVASAPTLQQFGIPINLKKVLEMWFEAAGITDIEAMFGGGNQEMLLQQIMAQMGGGQEAAGAPNVATQQGGPNLGGANAPTSPPDAENSGILPPQI